MATTRSGDMLLHRRRSSRARRLAWPMAFALTVSGLGVAPAHAAPEDILVGAFDAITEVPVMAILLGIVRSGERTSQSPEVLDERLRAVEAMVRDISGRLGLVETRLAQLQNEVVKIANINRLRELQRISSEIAEINAELKTHPADEAHRAILEFRARQQADQLKNNVGFDIWQWSEIDPASQTVITKFHALPSFELYAIAITTWFSALDLHSGTQPQRVVSDSGAALHEHAAFLRTRDGWHALRTNVAAA